MCSCIKFSLTLGNFYNDFLYSVIGLKDRKQKYNLVKKWNNELHDVYSPLLSKEEQAWRS